MRLLFLALLFFSFLYGIPAPAFAHCPGTDAVPASTQHSSPCHEGRAGDKAAHSLSCCASTGACCPLLFPAPVRFHLFTGGTFEPSFAAGPLLRGQTAALPQRPPNNRA